MACNLPLQVFYHLGDLDDALTYALGAGSLFDVNGASEYVQTILGERAERGSDRSGGHRLVDCLPSLGGDDRLNRFPAPFLGPSLIRVTPLLIISSPPVSAAARCIDTYVALRVKAAESSSSSSSEAAAPIDPRLTAIIERLFERCHADGQYEQAVGVALEARRLDRLEAAIAASTGGWVGWVRGCIVASRGG